MASIVADKVFERFPNVRIATIETGSEWVAPLLKKLRNVSTQMPGEFAEDPHEIFLEHVWVSPFFEDDGTRSSTRSAPPGGVRLRLPARRGARRAGRLRQGDRPAPATTSAGSCGTTPGSS